MPVPPGLRKLDFLAWRFFSLLNCINRTHTALMGVHVGALCALIYAASYHDHPSALATCVPEDPETSAVQPGVLADGCATLQKMRKYQYASLRERTLALPFTFFTNLFLS